MRKSKCLALIAVAAMVAQCTFVNVSAAISSGGITQPNVPAKSIFQSRFEELYNDIKNPANGYFSPEGVPYHSVETLICEAPDHGHESTSEAASYYLWLEAMNGKFSGNFNGLAEAWNVIENYYIPTDADQPGQTGYNPSSPATYASEYALPSFYPSELKVNVPVGSDPISSELETAYGTSKIYGMHWLIDADNFYGYGQRGDGISAPSYINTFQRGPQESVWETIPQPSWEEFKWGGPNGYLDLFTADTNYAKQWRYTNAPDADARAIQAMYLANQWAKEQGTSVDLLVGKASKMGDYLRYSFFDKYFEKIGAQAKVAGTGYDSAHYLLSWYYAWGGAMPGSGDWSWRIGCSHNHAGYQNPMAAYIMSTDPDFAAASPNATSDWATSLDRQIEFYQWLQSSEGGIAGGATNSYNGSYDTYPAGTSTFYGMAYEENPVYLDPGSNTWFGMQAWTMQRMAEYYYTSGDVRVKALLDKWAGWANSKVQLFNDGTFAIPSTISWSGQPDTWNGSYTGNNNLHVDVVNYGNDLGVSASLANALTYYAAATKKYSPTADYETYLNTAKEILDRSWNLYRDNIGVATPELRGDYARFFTQEVYVPTGFTGTMPNGDIIQPGVKFIDIRSNYKNDPSYQYLKNTIEAGNVPEFTYHRFWAQSEIAIANGTLAMLFPDLSLDPTVMSVEITSPIENSAYDYTVSQEPIVISANAEIVEGSISKVDFYADNTKIGSSEVAPYTCNFVPTNTGADENGLKTISLTAKAISDKGKVVSSNPINITVQFKVFETPVVTIAEPLEGTVLDTTIGNTTITVVANSSIIEGNIAKTSIYADNVKIGETLGSTCTATYTAPTTEGPEPDGLVDVIFTAVAVSDKDMEGNATPVTIQVKLPVPQEPPVSDIVVSVSNSSQTSTNTIGNSYTIQNNGTENVDLSKFKIRYYFTTDSINNINFTCDNGGMQLNQSPYYVNISPNTVGNFVMLATPVINADCYLEISFSNVTTPFIPGATITMGTRITNAQWQNFNQTNDYSYNSNNNVVLVYNGQVISGIPAV